MKTPFKTILKEVTEFLDNNLPKYLTYHNTLHTLYVLDRAIYIAKKENIKAKDLELLEVAALFHDIGFVRTHKEHEKVGCEIASEQLKSYGYSKEEIDKVCGMIMATKVPQQPKTHLEEIIADADLEYMATSKYQQIAHNLFIELQQYNPRLTTNEWNAIQIKFIESHNYHTTYCKRYKEFRKVRNLNALKKKI